MGSQAEIGIPEGCFFTGQEGTELFMELTENPSDGSELGVTLCGADDGSGEEPWFVVWSFDASGYVRDDERDQLDAAAILRSLQAGTEEGNKERRRRGWGTLSIGGWVAQPYYDLSTHNLTWAISAVDADGSESINHSVRLLGRSGVMHADLVGSSEQYEAMLPAFDDLISDFSYLQGHRYAEWREGDKIASYGLTALVAGGAGAVAMKTGLLAKLWKLFAAGIVAIGAAIKGFWRRLTGRGPVANAG